MHVDVLHLALLGLISNRGDGIHGYQLKADFDALYGDFWVLNYGQMYRALGLLARQGLIEGEECLQTGRPNKRIFRLQPAGRERFDDWLARPPIDGPLPLRDDLAIKLVFLTPERREDILAVVRAQRAIYLQHLGRVSKKRSRLEPANEDHLATSLILLQADMRVRADLAWLDQVEEAVQRRYRT